MKTFDQIVEDLELVTSDVCGEFLKQHTLKGILIEYGFMIDKSLNVPMVINYILSSSVASDELKAKLYNYYKEHY